MMCKLGYIIMIYCTEFCSLLSVLCHAIYYAFIIGTHLLLSHLLVDSAINNNNNSSSNNIITPHLQIKSLKSPFQLDIHHHHIKVLVSTKVESTASTIMTIGGMKFCNDRTYIHCANTEVPK